MSINLWRDVDQDADEANYDRNYVHAPESASHILYNNGSVQYTVAKKKHLTILYRAVHIYCM